MITREQAREMFESDDLIGIGMEADAIRRKLHPGGVVSYIIDRNINYTNFCTEYCSFCAFYRPPGHEEGTSLPHEVIFDKIQETIDLGGTGILMQGGLHPDLKIEWYEDLLRAIKQRFNIWTHCFSAPEIMEYRGSQRHLFARHHRPPARCRSRFHSRRRRGDPRRCRAVPHQPPQMRRPGVGGCASNRPCISACERRRP